MSTSLIQQLARIESALSANLDLKSRTLYLFGEIDGDMAKRTIISLGILDELSGDINIVINSSGGSDEEGLAIYDAIMKVKNNVIIYGTGCVQSMAAAIFQAADTRILSKHARFMIHNGSITLSGPIEVDKLLVLAEDTKEITKIYWKILSERSKLPISKIRYMSSKESYFSAQQCIDYNFADKIE